MSLPAVTVPLHRPQPRRRPSVPPREVDRVALERLDDAQLLRALLEIGGPIGPDLPSTVIAEAGGLRALAAAGSAVLASLTGLAPAQAVGLAAAFELGRRVAARRAEPPWRVRTPADVGGRLAPAMAHLEREELRVLMLDTKNVVTASVTVYAGNLAGSSVRVGEVFRDAVRRLAAAVVVVHNHPSGDPSPSADDLRITRELADAGRLLDIDLLDHVVVAGDRWVSLRTLGAI